jgi:hypothetical protein
MLFLSDKIKILNKILEAAFIDKRFTGSLWVNEVVKTAVIQNTDEATKSAPVYFKDNEYKYIGIDDTFPLIVYHKHVQSFFEEADGNERGETNRMQMVVFGRLDYLRLNNEVLGSLFVAAFPSEIRKSAYNYLGISSLQPALIDGSTDTAAIVAREYPGFDYQLGPEHGMLLFNYTLESDYNRNCFKACDCLPAENT